MAFRYKKGGADALRLTTAARTAKVWADGELLYDTDTDTLYVGDGSTAGGVLVSGPNDVTGPASSTDNAIARFDGTTGKIIQNSGASIDDSGNITGNNLSGTNTGNVTLSAIGSSPNANGASLSGQVLNLQPASAAFGGILTNGAQTIGGAKTFGTTPIFSALTAGSIPYIGTGGQVSQNNSFLFWDSSNQRLGIGTNSPGRLLDVAGSMRATSIETTGSISLTSGSIIWDGPAIDGNFTFLTATNPTGTRIISLPDSSGTAVLGTGANTRVSFWDATNSQSSNSNFTWDNTNSRLRVGTATSSYRLTLSGTDQFSGLQIDRSGNTVALSVGGNGLGQFVCSSGLRYFVGGLNTYNTTSVGTHGFGLNNIAPTAMVDMVGFDRTDEVLRVQAAASPATNIFEVNSSASVRYLCVGPSGQVGVNNISPASQLDLIVGVATRKGMIIKAAASQTANLTEWQNSAGTALATVGPNGKITTVASTTTIASLNIPSGTAPTSPVNGDIWSDGSDIKVRLGGVTYTLTKT